ncbi:sn-glycerol-3-phosphate ABC transporter ATP-binding protein UgpC [Allorhizobium sp. BGMRC 0089]|uniref:ABC transporter ATP-binding protein n=1 Tax=Allorhizobium sonneratiae TaxID=2934936 RepID=UPI0020342265|nr:sn-glycerol-3-phosphate ABC transporter ATP-binding protein UgpC [Allorhizobium sonneratiae]MCM2294068.1 sn-glycerol-3-phosphate ABC transporter ATP-binding protein UgpC [Allorhizobium sonneratiae]
MSTLTLSGLRKNYGILDVIKGVDLEIAEREFIVFVGPSGCGKSTLLRMIAGLETISGGDLFIGGRRMNDVEPSERGIAMVFQSYALYPHLTVRENMGFALRFAGVAKADIEKQVMEAARTLGLEKLMDRRPKDLSGGQRQRVAIGRAIVRHPQVFLFDEPLSNLDADLRVHMRIEIARLHRELNTTIIYVTHDQVEAMTLADRIVVLRDGAIEQVGTPLELYDRPDNLFVAGFIGSPRMNFLPVKTEEAGLRLTAHGDHLIPVTLPFSLGTSLTIGIRPEAFDPEAALSMPVTVEFVEHLGNNTLIHARAGSGDLLTISDTRARGLKAGDRYVARFDPARMLIFDGNGKRLDLAMDP